MPKRKDDGTEMIGLLDNPDDAIFSTDDLEETDGAPHHGRKGLSLPTTHTRLLQPEPASLTSSSRTKDRKSFASSSNHGRMRPSNGLQAMHKAWAKVRSKVVRISARTKRRTAIAVAAAGCFCMATTVLIILSLVLGGSSGGGSGLADGRGVGTPTFSPSCSVVGPRTYCGG